MYTCASAPRPAPLTSRVFSHLDTSSIETRIAPWAWQEGHMSWGPGSQTTRFQAPYLCFFEKDRTFLKVTARRGIE